MKTHPPSRRGFTMLELLTVIGIIVVLVAILVPTISAVRTSAYNADSQQHMQVIAAAAQRYYDDHRAYPGVYSNRQITTGVTPANAGGNVTMAENLVLALMGGLEPPAGSTGTPTFDESKVGSGPMSHNPNINARRRLPAYIDVPPGNGLPNKPWTSGGGRNGLTDSVIPEFMDKFPEPMPLLYLRARIGAQGITTQVGGQQPQYNPDHLKPYTRPPSGSFPGDFVFAAGKDFVSWDQYLGNKSIANTARNKDQYILIGPGIDRIFGTKDDLMTP